MAPKRKPKKLRHELEEYTSLLRALHTTSTQDIVPHLTGSFLPPTSPARISSRSQSLQRDPKDEIFSADKEGNGSLGEKAYKDIWTRWPLLKKNVYVPEWGLPEEVKVIAEKAARRWLQHIENMERDGSTSPEEEEPKDEDENVKAADGSKDECSSTETGAAPSPAPSPAEKPSSSRSTLTEEEVPPPFPEEVILTKSVLQALTLSSSNFLSRIFSTLAAYRPSVDISLQNRLGAIDWKIALGILSSAGIVEETVLEEVRYRMEAIYGPGDPHS